MIRFRLLFSFDLQSLYEQGTKLASDTLAYAQQQAQGILGGAQKGAQDAGNQASQAVDQASKAADQAGKDASNIANSASKEVSHQHYPFSEPSPDEPPLYL